MPPSQEARRSRSWRPRSTASTARAARSGRCGERDFDRPRFADPGETDRRAEGLVRSAGLLERRVGSEREFRRPGEIEHLRRERRRPLPVDAPGPAHRQDLARRGERPLAPELGLRLLVKGGGKGAAAEVGLQRLPRGVAEDRIDAAGGGPAPPLGPEDQRGPRGEPRRLLDRPGLHRPGRRPLARGHLGAVQREESRRGNHSSRGSRSVPRPAIPSAEARSSTTSSSRATAARSRRAIPGSPRPARLRTPARSRNARIRAAHPAGVAGLRRGSRLRSSVAMARAARRSEGRSPSVRPAPVRASARARSRSSGAPRPSRTPERSRRKRRSWSGSSGPR